MPDTDDDVILAVDLGLRGGLAVWQRNGVLRTWRTVSFRSRTALRQGVRTIAREMADATVLVTEGDRTMGRVWSKALPWADHVHVQAEVWRDDLFEGRVWPSGREAKRAADGLARTLIDRHAARGAPHLRHDAAEAICLGFWAGRRRGW